ncbi:MAG: DinB family protein [Candidatus Limnocylindria bacterium]
MAGWIDALESKAPDVVAVWHVCDGPFREFRRELRRRASRETAAGVLKQQEAVADVLRDVLKSLPDAALLLPGNEGDWNVAQTFAHTTAARRFLARGAALAATGGWPADDPPTPIAGIPGRDADREMLLALLEKSRRSIAESAALIAGHESDPCPMDHPLVGHLRCGEWLLFIGVHDLMHLEQLETLAARV